MSHSGEPSQWLRWLTGGDAEERQQARMILGGLEPEDTIDPTPLIEALETADDDLTFWCLVALGRIREGGLAAAARIRQIAASHHAFGVRQAALRALTRVAPAAPETRSAVLRALEDDSPFVRREALECMVTVASVSAGDLDRISAMAEDLDPEVARWSEIALRNIRSREADDKPADGD